MAEAEAIRAAEDTLAARLARIDDREADGRLSPARADEEALAALIEQRQAVAAAFNPNAATTPAAPPPRRPGNPHMSNSTNQVSHGVAGVTPISSTMDASSLSSTRYVTLSANYARVIPPGYPEPNPGAPAANNATRSPKTILSGSRVLLFAHEAAAIVAAGAGAYS